MEERSERMKGQATNTVTRVIPAGAILSIRIVESEATEPMRGQRVSMTFRAILDEASLATQRCGTEKNSEAMRRQVATTTTSLVIRDVIITFTQIIRVEIRGRAVTTRDPSLGEA